jgi:hypothetical protein
LTLLEDGSYRGPRDGVYKPVEGSNNQFVAGDSHIYTFEDGTMSRMRTTARQSEIDALAEAKAGNPAAREQVSLGRDADGRLVEVPALTKDSARIDVIDGKQAVEVKNWTLVDNAGTKDAAGNVTQKGWSAEKNIEDLINKTADQASKRAAILGDDYVQVLKIDIRGQNVSEATKNYIAEQVVKRSNGAYKDGNIKWM